MTDLVEKLRRRAKQNPTPGGLLVMVDPGTLNEAADEIERLRALKAKVDRLLKGIDHGEFWTSRPTDVTTWLRETTDD